MLFLSDVGEELDAAQAAGMHAVGVARDGSTTLTERSAIDAVVSTFESIDLDASAPRAVEAGTLGARLVAFVRRCHARGLVQATSGNFSVRISPDVFAITGSGLDKGRLTTADLVLVDRAGALIAPSHRAPSAETPLHAALYRGDPSIGAVAHTHSVAASVLSRRWAAAGAVVLEGYEMVKALGRRSHLDVLTVPIVANDQDAVALSRTVERRRGDAPAYLVEGHGLTTWGRDVEDAARHVEALEHLLECHLYDRG